MILDLGSSVLARYRVVSCLQLQILPTEPSLYLLRVWNAGWDNKTTNSSQQISTGENTCVRSIRRSPFSNRKLIASFLFHSKIKTRWLAGSPHVKMLLKSSSVMAMEAVRGGQKAATAIWWPIILLNVMELSSQIISWWSAHLFKNQQSYKK